MIKTDKREYKDLVIKTIEYLKNRGYTDIKADIKGYETPKSYEMRSEKIKVTPDIVSKAPHGKIHYVEVSVKSDDSVMLKSKWKFLNTLAKLKDRGFRIISHRGHYGFTDRLMNELDLSKTAVRI